MDKKPLIPLVYQLMEEPEPVIAIVGKDFYDAFQSASHSDNKCSKSEPYNHHDPIRNIMQSAGYCELMEGIYCFDDGINNLSNIFTQYGYELVEPARIFP